ncbi:MAG: N-6 DNA methylase [Actinobacteria bacterium]|nr:N-6 DNA methylase [Actinomycetota bacterium]
MLDSDTKRRIDTCRDILVGKVPDPKSQVEQITIALIYKFMDDMDAEAEAMGGKRSFFTGDYEKYGWSRLMAPNMGGFDVLSLYSEAIGKMNENPGVPALFRDIFKNAYLPYRDPETLRSFLKEINGFTYDHSERLGDAFEYLLSVLGSQGEAGQFRTPRHIIDFMVEIIDPKKDETILDPACGTAGFLISSYKHILKHNTKGYKERQDRETYDEKGVPLEALTLDSPLHYKGDLLTPDDKKHLAANIHGYDISPDMVRLSLVNMYLHGFTDPHIDEYDTLTSDEKWNELADVILANPPFMSPKGGIRPHKRFSVQVNRSEVLFVDYIAEHLTPNGRAAVVVPEGVIFQAGSAYKQLREMLVKDYLVAVISLPAGVFNPYSGVKTSILLLDKRLSRKTEEILFVKIDNDGFKLGAQRRPIEQNDLPDTIMNIKAWLASIRDNKNFDLKNVQNFHLETKARIGRDKEWGLNADRFRSADMVYKSEYELVSLGDVAEFKRGPFGSSIKKSVCVPKGKDTFKVYEQGNIIQNDFTRGEYYITQEKFDQLSGFELKPNDIAITCAGTLGKIAIVPDGIERGIINSVLMRIRIDKSQIDLKYFLYIFGSTYLQDLITRNSTGVAVNNLFATKELKKFKIPLPHLEVQQQIVKEVEGYQKHIEKLKQEISEQEEKIKDTINRMWGKAE